ncbi:MAG: hypothetical protein ACP5UB_06325 [Candidatus Sumerlaeaceae bacterium]
MTKDPKEKLLQGLQSDLSRKTYSFVEYITNASPYIPEHFAPLWSLLIVLRREEREHAKLLSRIIAALGGIPDPMLFDESAADLNYLRLDYLGQLLIKHKERAVTEFEQRVAEANGFPEIRAVLLELLAAEKDQLQRIRNTFEECRAKEKASADRSGDAAASVHNNEPPQN